MSARLEHLDWCKKRALEYANKNQLTLAFASIISDLRKGDDDYSVVIDLGIMLSGGGFLSTKKEMVDYIEGIG